MNERAINLDRKIVIERTYAASIEDVWELWTSQAKSEGQSLSLSRLLMGRYERWTRSYLSIL
jgi:hypothetical protein